MRSVVKKVVIRTGVLAVLAGIAIVALPGRSAARPDFVNTASGAFNITGTLEGMYPGRETSLVLTVENPQTTQLNLSSVTASVTSAVYTGTNTPAPAKCAEYLSPNLPHTWTSWTGATTVPGASSPTTPGSITISVPLSFANAQTNQDVCEHVTFTLGYAGSAYYTDPTTTGVTASPSPAIEGSPVTLSATVTPTYSGATPTGSVTFKGPSGETIGAPVMLAPASGDQATASLTTTSLPTGADHIEAVYSPTGTHNGGSDFFGSTAATTETVDAGCVTTPTSKANTVITGTYNGNYDVKPGQSLWLNGGTITGNVRVDAGAQFSATNGTIGGNLSANGDTAVIGTAIMGNAQSSNAAMSIGARTNLKGNVQSRGGGPVCLNYATVGGNVQLQRMTSTSLGGVCATTVGNDLQVQNSAEPVQIGGTPTCAGNAIGGNLQVHDDTAKVTLGGIAGSGNYGNRATGEIQVEGNSGGGSLVGNTSTSGNCQLQNNAPGIAGSSNTVSSGKTNTCNRTA